jgi:hypothetical protein
MGKVKYGTPSKVPNMDSMGGDKHIGFHNHARVVTKYMARSGKEMNARMKATGKSNPNNIITDKTSMIISVTMMAFSRPIPKAHIALMSL